MRGSRKFPRGGPTFSLVDERSDDPNTTKSGPSSTHLQNAIKMEFCWRADDGPTLNAGLAAFGFFRGSDQYC